MSKTLDGYAHYEKAEFLERKNAELHKVINYLSVNVEELMNKRQYPTLKLARLEVASNSNTSLFHQIMRSKASTQDGGL